MNRRDFFKVTGAMGISSLVPVTRSSDDTASLEMLLHSVANSGSVRRTRKGMEAVCRGRDMTVKYAMEGHPEAMPLYEVIYRGQMVFKGELGSESIIDRPGAWEDRARDLYHRYYCMCKMKDA